MWTLCCYWFQLDTCASSGMIWQALWLRMDTKKRCVDRETALCAQNEYNHYTCPIVDTIGIIYVILKKNLENLHFDLLNHLPMI